MALQLDLLPPQPDDDKAQVKQKRKRSRVTPDQLARLEHFFALDRNPTASRRKEISALLNMQERQTQIWFQNRRAKAKLQDGKLNGQSTRGRASTNGSDHFSDGLDDLPSIIHEDKPVSLISCTDLSIGTWRRIATPLNQSDLLAYACFPRRCLTWFILSAGYGFKMEVPFDSIVDMEFLDVSNGHGLIAFMLSDAPSFFMESVSASPEGSSSVKAWKRSTDWTEGHQASQVFRHELVGSYVDLGRFLSDLHPYLSGLEMNSFVSGPQKHFEVAPLAIPTPPMAGLTPPLYHSYEGSSSPSEIYATPSPSNGVDHLEYPAAPHSAPAATSSYQSPLPEQSISAPLSAGYQSSQFSEQTSEGGHYVHSSEYSVHQDVGQSMYNPHLTIQHSYAGETSQLYIDRSPYSETPSSASSADVPRQQGLNGSDAYSSLGESPSASSVLTTPYNPQFPSHLLHHSIHSSSESPVANFAGF